MSQSLPSRPNLDHLKKQAKDVLRVSRRLNPHWRLVDAQHALARGYGFRSWSNLKEHVELAHIESDAVASSVSRERESATSGDAPPRVKTKGDDRPVHSIHPIVGTWMSRPGSDLDRRPFGEVVVEFELSDSVLRLTQIAAHPEGHVSAMKMALHVDDQEHPLPFGYGLMLQAKWADDRTLDTVVKDGERTVSEGTYRVTPDGQSLVVSTTNQRMVFERVQAAASHSNRPGRISMASLALFLAVATSGCSFETNTGGPMQTQANPESDRRAIEALNQHDVKAAMSNDINAIVSQWTDDFVILPPAGPIVRGRSANAAAAEQGKQQMQALIPVDYDVKFEEIMVTGDYAFEWGTYRGAARPRAGGSDITYSGKLMRILQRQSDGTWKMHRTMMTTDSQPPQQ